MYNFKINYDIELPILKQKSNDMSEIEYLSEEKLFCKINDLVNYYDYNKKLKYALLELIEFFIVTTNNNISRNYLIDFLKFSCEYIKNYDCILDNIINNNNKLKIFELLYNNYINS